MEKLSLNSFLKNGHEVHLYAYDEVFGVPDGVLVKDGNTILPSTEFDYRRFINNGTFADFFRYRLLFEKGGWWVDTDLVCLRPFDFQEPYVMGRMGPWEDNKEDTAVCNNCMKFPARSNIMEEAWNTCKSFDPSKVKWSTEVGPMLVHRLATKYSMSVLGTQYFNPVNWQRVKDMSDPTVVWEFPKETYAVHLWNDMWSGRTNWEDKMTWEQTGCPPILQSKENVVEGSLYGELVKRYL